MKKPGETAIVKMPKATSTAQTISSKVLSMAPLRLDVVGTLGASGRPCYFDLIVAASLARFFCHASYSAVPGRGGTPLGIPPSHVGTLSATMPLTEGLGSVAQAGSIVQAMAISAGLVALNFITFITAITRPNHA